VSNYPPFVETELRCCVHKSQPLDTILSQMNPVQNITPYFSTIHHYIFLQFTPDSPKWSLSPQVLNQNCVSIRPLRSVLHASLTLTVILLIFLIHSGINPQKNYKSLHNVFVCAVHGKRDIRPSVFFVDLQWNYSLAGFCAVHRDHSVQYIREGKGKRVSGR
jgi:hypothetical protein